MMALMHMFSHGGIHNGSKVIRLEEGCVRSLAGHGAEGFLLDERTNAASIAMPCYTKPSFRD